MNLKPDFIEPSSQDLIARACDVVAISVTTIPVPCHVVESLLLS